MALAWLAASFLAGIGAGTGFSPPLSILFLLAIGSAGAAWKWRRFALALLCVSAFLMGFARSPHGTAAPGPGATNFYNGRLVSLTGVVSEEPDVRDTGINVVVDVRQILVGGRAIAASGLVEVHSARSQVMEYGDLVTLTGRLHSPTNSGRVPYADVLARRGIRSTMRFPRVLDAGPSATGPLGWIVPFRIWLENNIDSWLPEPEAALLIAITLGAHSASLGDLAPRLVSTGLIHIIAISGIKVAMIAGTLYALASRLRAPRIALFSTLGAVWLYVLLTGATVSGERSAAMWSLVFVGASLGRGTVAVVSLSVVAAVMVAMEPGVLWEPAFLLTTVGTFAIIAFTNPILYRIRAIPFPLRESFGVTLAAQIGTLPIVIIGFHIVSLTGPIANTLVLPLLPLLIAVGFLVGVCAPSAVLAAPISAVTYALLHSIVLVVSWLAGMPGAISVSSLPAALSAAYFVLLGAFALHFLRREHFAPVGRVPVHGRAILIGFLVAASLATASESYARDSSTTRLIWLGSGDSMLLRTGGKVVLIDGSPRPYVLLERLAAGLPYGTRTIDAIVATDARAGNVVGLRAILQHYRVSEVLDVGAEYPSSTYAAWRSDLVRLHIPAYSLRTGVSLRLATVSLTAVGPDGLSARPQDSAGMLRIREAGRTVLLAGTASEREQHEAIFRGAALRSDVLFLNGLSGCEGEFIHQVSAAHVYTISCTLPSATVLNSGQNTVLASAR